MSSAPVTQIPRNLLFRYRLPCRRLEGKAEPLRLGEEFRLPVAGRFEGQRAFADWRVAWCDAGLRVSVIVAGKSTSVWCKLGQLMESDGVHLLVDTRATHDVHRATRYCHWIVAMPAGGTGGGGLGLPVCTTPKINRAKEESPAINRAKAQLAGKLRKDGYELDLFLPAAMLNGWSPAEQPLIGFFIAIADRELGWQTLGVGPELPVLEDPSLWQTLRLVEQTDSASRRSGTREEKGSAADSLRKPRESVADSGGSRKAAAKRSGDGSR